MDSGLDATRRPGMTRESSRSFVDQHGPQEPKYLQMAYYVYLLASKKHGTLYLGVTNDIVRRVYEHKTKAVPGFTTRYGVDKLVWFEIYEDATTAITREKELKKWRRDWKIRLIEEQNPGWVDLYPGISS
jgi:putative endonuclease